MFVVLSLGGSLVNPDKPNTAYLKKLAALVGKSRHSFGIVCGGGKVAREYAQAARVLGGSEFEADEIAIQSTVQNAKLVAIAFHGMSCPKVFTDFDSAADAAGKYKIVVMGGTIPGITTDTDAALLAEKLGACRIINMSNVNGVYSENPYKNKKAVKFPKMTFAQLIKLAGESDTRAAGTHFVFDYVACKMIARSKIETHFLDGKKLNEIASAIEGRKHSGTVVKG